MLLVAGYFVSGLVERKLIADETEVGVVRIIVWVFLAWTIFITVSLFRSAKKYRRTNPHKWLRARLAQVFACLVIVLLLVDFGGVWRKNATLAELDAAVAEVSRRGPRTLEDGVRYDGLSRHGRVLVYNMTVTDPNGVPSAEQIEQVRKDTVAKLCKDEVWVQALESLDKITYQYDDEAGRHLISYDILRSDCPE